MHELILWSGFFGAWLLVAGPLYQAALELRDENLSREDMAGLQPTEPTRKRPSGWWWLIPPVGYLKQRRYAQDEREAMMAALPRDVMTRWVSFMNKATAWFYVASGAFLIALKETYELVEGHEWPTWVFWVLVVVMAGIATVNTAVRMNNTHQLVEQE
jgi:hypothetical protein